MSTHRFAAPDLDVELRQLVRSGERIDTMYLDDDGHWIVITEDRIEVRPVDDTHASRLGIHGRFA